MTVSSARALLDHGLEGLTLFDVNPKSLKESLETLQEEYPRCPFNGMIVDSTDEAVVKARVDQAVAEGEVGARCWTMHSRPRVS